MRTWTKTGGLALSIVALVGSSSVGQTGRGAAGSGIKPTTIIDRPEIRIVRAEFGSKAAAGRHSHDDLVYQLIVPVSGPIDLDFDGKIVHLEQWQMQFIVGGTAHAI